MSRRGWTITVALAAAVMLVAAGGLVWWFQRGEAPAAVDLASAVAQIEAAESVDAASDPPETAAPSTIAPTTTEVPADTTDDSSGDDSATTAPSTIAPATTEVPADATDDSSGDNSVAATDVGDEASPDAAADENASTDDDSTTGTATAEQEIDPLAHLSGVWTVQVAESAFDLLDNPAVSFAGYRVAEVLAGGLGENTAVGRTADVTGSMEFSGGRLVAAAVEVTMATLRTDDSHRDSHARGSLNTKEFPQAMFTLVEPLDLPAGMADGEAFSGSAEGALTIRGVTKRATFDLQAQLVGESIVAVGSSPVVFSDYGVDTPTSIAVISVEDHGIMEFQLIFSR